jgi:membrane fusion protein, heavy metal efflux system
MTSKSGSTSQISNDSTDRNDLTADRSSLCATVILPVRGNGVEGRGTFWVAAAPALIALVALVAALSSCSRPLADASMPAQTTSSPSSSGGNAQATLFSVPQDQMAHLQIVTVATSTLRRVLRLTGAVAYNSFETTPVLTQISGPVSRILVVPGEFVKEGQPLLYVSSPDFAQLRTNYLKAQDALKLAQISYARAQDLYDHHVIALADLQQAESTRNQAQADLDAATQSLRVLGIRDLGGLEKAPLIAEIPVLSPISGEVVERLVSPGQVVQAGGTQAFTVSNMNTIWVLINVYEHDLGFVHLGDPASIHTDAYPTEFQGRVSFIAPALDPTSRTAQVRVVTQNPGGKLKKDMYVTATLQAGVIKDAIQLPNSAVLRDPQNEPFVYVERGTHQFAERSVRIGETQDGYTQILQGLNLGERVVADGSLFLQFANSLQQ